MSQRRVAPLAQAGAGGDPRRDAQAARPGRDGPGVAAGLGTLAGRPDDQADAAGRAAAAADAAGDGQPGRPQDPRLGLLALRERAYGAAYVGGRAVAERRRA